MDSITYDFAVMFRKKKSKKSIINQLNSISYISSEIEQRVLCICVHIKKKKIKNKYIYMFMFLKIVG